MWKIKKQVKKMINEGECSDWELGNLNKQVKNHHLDSIKIVNSQEELHQNWVQFWKKSQSMKN